MTREEHLAWCKKRALEYLPHDPPNAFNSTCSDMLKHDDTRDHIGLQLGMRLMMAGHMSDPGKIRKWIEGFN